MMREMREMKMEKLNKLAERCKASVHLEYRSQSAYYQTLTDLLRDPEDKEQFLSEEDYQICLATDKYWELQFYPDTPVGFYKLIGSDVEKLLDRALEVVGCK